MIKVYNKAQKRAAKKIKEAEKNMESK